MLRVLVTGSTGFVGRALVRRLEYEGHEVLPLPRSAWGQSRSLADTRRMFDGVEVIIHLAARAHVLTEQSADPLAEFRVANVERTHELAEMAVREGVRRFVFVSSIGVHGDKTEGQRVNERSPITPVMPYAVSKWEAEAALREFEAKHGLDVVVVRPTLVYGAGVKGNFLRLMQVVDSGLPLPLASVRNMRSFVGLDNLCSLLSLCVTHRRAAGATFVAADGEDISTPELLRAVSAGLGRPARLLPCPVGLLRMLARLSGREQELRQLIGSLQVDASLARAQLGWQPHRSLTSGLEDMTRWYVEQVRG